MYKKLIDSVKIFEDLPRNILNQVLVSLRPEIFLPHEQIIKAGGVGDTIYFLASGTVAVSTPSGREVCHLQDGAYFGEIAVIIPGKHRTANVIAIEICEVYQMDKKSFKNCFSKDTDLFNRIYTEALDRADMTEMIENAYTKVMRKTLLQEGIILDL